MIDEREEENGEEYIPVETGEAFWKAINRGEVVEPGRELGERTWNSRMNSLRRLA